MDLKNIFTRSLNFTRLLEIYGDYKRLRTPGQRRPIWASVQVLPAPLSNSLLMHLGKEWRMAQILATLQPRGAPRWSSWLLAQSWLLQPFREWTNRWMMSLSIWKSTLPINKSSTIFLKSSYSSMMTFVYISTTVFATKCKAIVPFKTNVKPKPRQKNRLIHKILFIPSSQSCYNCYTSWISSAGKKGF